MQLEDATFATPFIDELQADPLSDAHSRDVPGFTYSMVKPTPVPDPAIVAWSHDLGNFLSLDVPPSSGKTAEILSGNTITETMRPYASRYGGHQFGVWAGQLGDGRAISLGSLPARDGSLQELQLKGAGPTPYSRRGDGRAVLRSSLREFLCSEAMHHLGVPTTRALALVTTGESVIRDMFYTGDAKPEPGSIVTRVAPSFIRFGNFEIHAALDEYENLKLLTDYVIRHHYPEFGPPSPENYIAWFEEVSRRTARLIAAWMSVGFVHGVMNTDNMSILGLTIDYGPYGWLEPYDPEWTPNTTDFSHRRYAYGQQPHVGMWNVAMLARALAPLVGSLEKLEPGINLYAETFSSSYRHRMLEKIGLPLDRSIDHEEVLGQLQHAMMSSQVDLTIFFRKLSDLAPVLMKQSGNTDEDILHFCRAVSYLTDTDADHSALRSWMKRYQQLLNAAGQDPDETRRRMLEVNPKYVLRNYLAQQAIDDLEKGDAAFTHRLLAVLQRPFDDQPEAEELFALRPEWARTRAGCATLSCSS